MVDVRDNRDITQVHKCILGPLERRSHRAARSRPEKEVPGFVKPGTRCGAI
jgi:hypothetical protein